MDGYLYSPRSREWSSLRSLPTHVNGQAKWLLVVVEEAEEEQSSHVHSAPTSGPPYPYSAPEPPSQHYNDMNDDWRIRGDKEPFSFSAFPSCFSSLPFSLPPRFPPEQSSSALESSGAETHAYDARDVCPAHSTLATGNGGRRESDATSAKRASRGEAEMDELLSALISPSPFSATSATWDWDT